jgi:hypothetical protein
LTSLGAVVKMPGMGWLSTLRAKWRRHDEKLAERQPLDRDVIERVDELGDAVADNPLADIATEHATRSEDALEHDQPR